MSASPLYRPGSTALRLLLGALLFLSATLTLAAQTRIISGPPHFRAFQEYESDGHFTRAVLRNGMTLLIEEHHVYPVAAITAYVDNSGLNATELAAAEVLGRLWQRRLAESQAAYERGAKVFFSSDADRNFYVLLAPGRSLPRALEAHADFWTAPSGQSGELNGVLSEMRESARLRESQPLAGARAKLLEMGALSKNWPAWGRAEVEALAAGDLAAAVKTVFEKTHLPERVILCITGSVFAENVLKTLVDEHAPRKGSGTPVRITSAPSIGQVAAASGLAFRHIRQGDGGHLVLAGLPTVGWAHSDHLKVELLKSALGMGRGSLMGRYLEESGQALSARISSLALARGGLLSFQVAADPQHIDAAEASLLTQMEVLRTNPLTPLLLQRAKAQLVRSLHQRLQSLQGRAEALTRAEAAGDYKARDAFPSKVAAISAADLRQAARRYLDVSRLALLEHFPNSAEERTFDSASFAQTMEVLVKSSLAKQTEIMNVPETEASAEGLTVDFPFTPSYDRSDMKRTSVLRGPEIFLQEQHDLPLVDLGLFFTGGRVDEAEQASGVTELLLRALLRGGDEESPQLPLQRLEAMGADIEVVNETDFFGYRATLLSAYRSEFFGTLLEWLREAELADDKVESEKRRLLARQLEGQGELESDLQWTRRQLFLNQPYGKSRYGTSASVASLGMEQVRAWKEEKIDRRHPWILVRGDFNGTTFVRPFISRLSNSRLESVSLGRRQIDEYGYESESRRPESAGEEVVTVVREGQIIVGYTGPAKGTREEWMVDILQNLLQGVGGRLQVLLQEEEQESVSVRMLHEAAQRKGALFALAETDPADAEAAQRQIVARLAGLRNAVIRPLTWNYALVSTITDFHRLQQQGADYTLELARNILAGQATRFERAYINAVREAKPADLQALAAVYFPPPEEEEEDDSEDGDTSPR
ncbi:MAG TPA: insulinase family protein [Acidobacteriota bacterium]|nr:insulinase family protein [Acidobacteriota bacterium]